MVIGAEWALLLDDSLDGNAELYLVELLSAGSIPSTRLKEAALEALS
jgi:hypothetical protein